MSKETIIKLLSGLSLATIDVLTSRDNGIGSVKFKGVEGFNELFKIRKSIVDEKIQLRLRDKSVSLNHKSFLGNISDDVIRLNTYSKVTMMIDDVEIPMVNRLADIVEQELRIVRDEFIPMVNELSAKVEDELSSLVVTNIGSDFNIKYRNTNTLLDILSQVGDIVKTDVKTSGMNAKLPAIESINELLDIITIGNPIIDNEIKNIINTESDSYWVEVYNSLFTDINSTRGIITSLNEDLILNINKNIIIYLIARKLNKGFTFTVEGNKEDILFTLRVFKEYMSNILAKTIEMLESLRYTKTLIVYNKNKTIIVDKSLMEDGIDADVIISAAMDNILSQKEVLESKDELKDKYIKANQLFIDSESSKLASKYRNTIMQVLDGALADCDLYTNNRAKFSGVVFGSDIDKLKNVKKMISKCLLHSKFIETNADFILSKMKAHARASEGNELDFNTMSEYIALEMVCEYLVNTHTIIG